MVMANIDIHMKKVVGEIPVIIKIKGILQYRIRLKIAMFLIKLGSKISGLKVDIQVGEK